MRRPIISMSCVPSTDVATEGFDRTWLMSGDGKASLWGTCAELMSELAEPLLSVSCSIGQSVYYNIN